MPWRGASLPRYEMSTECLACGSFNLIRADAGGLEAEALFVIRPEPSASREAIFASVVKHSSGCSRSSRYLRGVIPNNRMNARLIHVDAAEARTSGNLFQT